MASVKCTVCDAVCDTAYTVCNICGSTLNAQQVSGFGQQAVNPGSPPQSGFGAVAQTGFGSPPAMGQQTAGFGAVSHPGFGVVTPSGFESAPQESAQVPAQSGFGKPIASSTQMHSGFGDSTPYNNNTPPATGFGCPPQTGFGSEAALGYGAVPDGFDQTAPPNFNVKPQVEVENKGMTAESARFADTVGSVLNKTDSVHWSFMQCLFFLLKLLIPIYGLIVLIKCLIGNPRIFPAVITNYMRASIVFSVACSVLGGILSLILSATAASLLTGAML